MSFIASKPLLKLEEAFNCEMYKQSNDYIIKTKSKVSIMRLHSFKYVQILTHRKEHNYSYRHIFHHSCQLTFIGL